VLELSSEKIPEQLSKSVRYLGNNASSFMDYHIQPIYQSPHLVFFVALVRSAV
jgi:hypothetical protein